MTEAARRRDARPARLPVYFETDGPDPPRGRAFFSCPRARRTSPPRDRILRGPTRPRRAAGGGPKREVDPVSLYYEDVEIGAVYESPGRTITEADVVAFAA